LVSFGNVLWVLLFGWILYVGYALAALIMCLTIAGIPYGALLVVITAVVITCITIAAAYTPLHQ
jgi:uncharacterized membrane protein YccF (DUF307 family)